MKISCSSRFIFCVAVAVLLPAASLQAAEKGVVPDGEEVVAVGGTGTIGFTEGGGADTAVVMIPRTSEQFNTLPEKADRREVKEIICKPR